MLPSRTITRFSHPSDANFRLYNGFVKLRLAHSKYGSLVLPDHLFIKAAGRWRFFQPSFFLASHIGFDVGPNLHSAMFESSSTASISKPKLDCVTGRSSSSRSTRSRASERRSA